MVLFSVWPLDELFLKVITRFGKINLLLSYIWVIWNVEEIKKDWKWDTFTVSFLIRIRV